MKKMVVSKPSLAVVILAGVTLPWQLGGKEPVALLVSIVLIALAAFLLMRSPSIKPAQFRWLDWLPLVFLGWGALSIVWSVNRYQSVMWLAVVGIGVMMYFLARSFGSNAELRRLWLTVYIGIVTAASVWGIVMYLSENYERLTSSFYLANPFAAYVLPALLLAVWYFAKTGRRFMAVCAPILLASLVLTDSRSSFLMMGLAVLAGLTLRLKTEQWLRILGVVGVAAVLTLSLNVARSRLFHHSTSLQGSRFSEALKGESTSASDRLYYLKSAAAIWRTHPITGTGAGTFASVHPQFQYRVISASASAHNFYVQVLAELGIVGALLAISVAGLLILLAIRAFRVKSDRVLALVLLVIVVHIALDIESIYPVVLAAMGALAGFISLSGAKSRGSQNRLLTLVLVVSLLLLVPVSSAYVSRLHTKTALANQDAGDYALAADDYNLSHSLLVYDPDVLTAEGINLYTLAGLEQDKAKAKAELAQAANLAQEAHKLDPYDSQHEFLYARVLLRGLNVDDAEKAYELAIQLDPYNHPEYYKDLAYLYLLKSQSDKVIATTTAAINEYPDSVIANRNLISGLPQTLSALYYYRAEAQSATEIEKARADASRALVLDPTNKAAAALLGQ